MNPALLVAHAAALERDDPLARFRFRCQGQRDYARWFFAGVDTHAFAPNAGGKSYVGGACVIAIMQGRRTLDGLPVPQVPLPITFWGLTKTRRGQVDSLQAAMLTLIGDYPSKIGFAHKALNYIEQIRIKHRTSGDDPEKWPKFTFHCEEGSASLPGGRIDGALGDEPLDVDNWTEVRARVKPGRQLYLGLEETPIKRSEWWWIFEDDRGYRNCLNDPRGGRVSVNWKIEDVHPPHVVAAMRERYAGDPMIDARMTGWPVNDESSFPFDGKILAAWRERCVAPQIVTVPLFLEGEDESDRETLAERVSYQVWTPRHHLGRYSLIGDPSAGINDGAHDPSGFHVIEETDPALVCRYGGYLDAFSFGTLAGVAGRSYGNAGAHIETQGGSGYGGEAIRALRRMRYPNIGHDMIQNNATGKADVRYGFSTTVETRKQYVAAIQGAHAIEKATGKPVIKVWSKEVVDCLADTVFDKKTGKVVAAAGGHLEDMICLGYALHRLGLPRKLSRRDQRELDPVGVALRKEFGRDIRPPKRRTTVGVPEMFRS